MPRMLVLSLLVGTTWPAHAQTARRLTMTDAVRLAVDRGNDIQVAETAVTATRERVSGARAQRLPRLRAEANLQHWDKPLDVSFGPMPGMTPMAMATPPLRVRDQLTWQATVSLVQPISGLLAIERLIGLEQNGVDAARADSARARLDTAQRAAEAYLRLLEAKALLGIADKSVTQVEAQLARARVLEKGGMLGPIDVLRLTSARDTARQGAMGAQGGVTIGTAALVLALDLPAGTAIEVVDDLPDPPPAIVWREQGAAKRALAERPELKAAEERAQQALAARSVAKAQLLPNILAMATYQHTEGQSAFMPRNAWFIGGTLSWDLWDWGHNWSAVKEAEARANGAAIASRSLRDQVVFDAERRLVEARTRYEMLPVARTALQAAEEAHRIQTVRYEAGAATTTDVIDAETEVFRARSRYAQARYEYYLAQAGLARAVGRLPSIGTGGSDAAR